VLIFAACGLAPVIALASEPVAPVPREANAAPSDSQFAFDIPVQALSIALDAYSIAAHREVLYDGRLAAGRKSSAVKGNLTPQVALQMLLEGTGLVPHYMAADAFVLVEDNPPLVPVNAAPPEVVSRYYGRIQASLRQAFCANGATQPGNYRVAVGFRIEPAGAVSSAELLGSTGDLNLDAMIRNTVRGLVVGAPPPRGFAQPVVLVVTPQSQIGAGDCEKVDARSAKVVPKVEP
jgi:TonB family protein